jgi:hypothetical protein
MPFIADTTLGRFKSVNPVDSIGHAARHDFSPAPKGARATTGETAAVVDP